MNKHFVAALAIGAALASSTSRAEDIDLFSTINPNSAGKPNVLFIIDNTANWNTAFTNEMNALAGTFNDIPADTFNIGLAMFTETGSGNDGNDGAYVRAGVRPMTTANKALYKEMILRMDQTGDKSNGGKGGLAMAEAYFYFKGGTPHGGGNSSGKAKADFTGNNCSTGCNLSGVPKTAMTNVWALSGNALNTKSSASYNSPVVPGSCAKNFIIYLSNGPAQDNSSDTSTSNSYIAAAGGDTTQIAISPNGSQTNPADEWARLMKKDGLAKVYTIDVQPSNTGGQYPGWQALLKSMAAASDGKYFFVDPTVNGEAKIADAINKILSEIQAVNSVFASVSLPVSVNTQGSFLNQVYVGLFRPDTLAAPRWNGNLKQYKLNLTGDTLRLVDADDQGAINTSTGFITQCARSFWTPSTIDTYWTFKPQGDCLAIADSKNSNTPDGDVVEKGGHAYMMRGATTPTVANSRTLKTCSSTFASCTALTDFNDPNASITAALVGAASAAERTSFINWGRGTDVKDAEENNNTNLTEVRASAHGDVIHSRPVALNFGPDSNPKVGVFYGANDGVFRTINGNRTAAIGTKPAGAALFEFMPPEFYGSIKRIYENAPPVSIPGVPGGQPKPYGMDGPVIGYDAGSERWIYSTMRRGGRALYAFAVNATDPAAVTLKWKRGCPNPIGNDTGCTALLSGFGQTWASPSIFKANGYSSGTAPLLVMGGGYDTCEDNDTNPTTACATPKGNKVYILDANTGGHVKTFDTLRSVVADVLIVPDSNGLARYGYTADLGGNIYRITFGNGAVSSWSITKIAALGCATPATCGNNRKFMFAPDVVEGDNGEFILLVGAGDREKPIEFYTGAAGVPNAFFMVRDKPGDNSWLPSENANCGADVICLASLVSIPANSTTSPTPAELAVKKGWYLGLIPKEQVVTSAITIFGVVHFSTQEPEPPPPPGSCASGLGTTRLYRVAADNAGKQEGMANRFDTLPDVGLPPSPVAGLVTLDTGVTVPFCIGCDPTSPLEATLPKLPPAVTPAQPKSRTYWYIEQ